MARVRMGGRRSVLALALALLCVGAAAGTFALRGHKSSPAKKRVAEPTGAVGPTGPDRPAYPVLLKHALSGVASVEIRRASGTTTIVKRPATVRQIASWFEALPHLPPSYVSELTASDSCTGYRPVGIRFDFHGGDGRVLLSALDRVPNPTAGFCRGSISFNGRALLDRDFLSRVSGLIGVDLSANPRTLRNEEAAMRDAHVLLGRVRVPPGSQLVATSPPTVNPFAHSVSATRVWRVRLPWKEVYKWVKAHPPRGSGPGDFSDAYGWDGNHGHAKQDLGDGYGYPPLAGIPYREVDLDVWRFVRHGVWTRIVADVSETWTVARPPGAEIPGGVRTLVIHGLGRHVRRIRNPDVIARIVRWFDSRDVIQEFVGECGPGGPHPGPVHITFVGTTGTVLATATDPRTNHAYGGHCNPISLRVHGQKQPELDPGYDDWFERFLR